MAAPDSIRKLLGSTAIPTAVIEALVSSASPLWIQSAPAAMLARDLVLCHPPLGANEVRAVAYPLDEMLTRLTVVAHDRHGLLADTTAVLAAEGVSIQSASVSTWTDPPVALHALTVRAGHLDLTRWDEIGERLRAAASGEKVAMDFFPTGRADVECSPVAGDLRVLSVTADDQDGLLWAICRWLADHELSIQSAHVDEAGGKASDRFVIVGSADPIPLGAFLTSPANGVVGQVMDLAVGAPERLLRRLRSP